MINCLTDLVKSYTFMIGLQNQCTYLMNSPSDGEANNNRQLYLRKESENNKIQLKIYLA